MLESIKTYKVVDEVILAIADSVHNNVYVAICEERNINFVMGDQEDVLYRLISATEKVNGTDIFRLTSESPFTFFEMIEEAWHNHLQNDNDLTTVDDLPDGSGFEIIKLEAYQKSWKLGSKRHRSELCSLFIRENKELFKLQKLIINENFKRLDIRLTVDNPEDLIVCRFVYDQLKHYAPNIPLKKIIRLLDDNPDVKKLVEKYIEAGLKTMYL